MGKSSRRSPERKSTKERERDDEIRSRKRKHRDDEDERHSYRQEREESRGQQRDDPVNIRIKQERERHGIRVKQERDRYSTSNSRTIHERDRDDISNVRIKQEGDRDYDRENDRHRQRHQRSRNNEEDIKPDLRRLREEREMNDERRRRDRANRPANPFETASVPGTTVPNAQVKEEPKEKEKPNFETSGALTEDTNTFRGVVIKYNEPSEARKPKRKWRFYVFKGEQELPLLHIHRQSAYLLGRDRKIADIPVDHPSCSKQHAVLQYRLVAYQRDDGSTGKRVRPYIIDLDSANGTFLNNKKIDPQRYYELQEKDVVKFGFSSRDYVLLHDKSAGDEDDVE